MPFLLDTNTLSEFIARRPDRGVIIRLKTLPAPETYIPAVAIGEIKQGIEEMPDSKRKSQLAAWLFDQLLPAYMHRVIPFDRQEALRWGTLRAQMRRQGTKMETEDSLIAATALTHNLTVVTRNVIDFMHAGVRTYNPWQA